MHRKLIFITSKLLSLLFFLGAVVLLFTVYYLELNDKLEILIISFACSVIGASIASRLIAGSLKTPDNLKKLIAGWGLENIYRTGKESRKKWAKAIKSAVKEIDCILPGDENILKPFEKVLLKKLGQDFKVRIIFPSPDSPFMDQFEKELGLNPGVIKEEIKSTAAFVEEIRKKSKKPEFIQSKLHRNLPESFYIRVDCDIFFSPYLKGINPGETVTYQFCKSSQGFEYYNRFFEKRWMDE